MMKPLNGNLRLNPAFSAKSCLLIVLSGILAYGNHLHNSFQFDTVGFFASNPFFLNPEEILQYDYWITHFSARGLLQISMALNIFFGGMNPFGFHLVNLWLHLLNSILVFFISWKACGHFDVTPGRAGRELAQSVSLFTALLFLLHPIQTESVVYVISRSEVFAATFYLSVLYGFQSFLECERISWHRCLLWAGLLIILFILGFSVKQTVITLPLILVLYYLCGCRPGSAPLLFLDKWKWVLVAVVGIFSGLLAIKLFTDEQFLIGPSEAGEIIGRKAYLLSQPGVILLYYVKLLFFPVNLNIDPDVEMVTQFFSLRFWASLGFFVFLIYKTFRSAGTRIYFFLVCWFLVVLSPSSSIITLHDLAAEHRVYLASYAFYFSFALGVTLWPAKLFQKRFRYKWISSGSILMCAVIFLGAATLNRNGIWKSEVSLWDDALKKSPRKVRPMINLARAHSLGGKTELAVLYYEKALKEMPYDFVANYNLGEIYLDKGLTEKALALFHRAYQISPHIAETPAKLGEIYLSLKDFDQANLYLRRAVEQDPGLAVAFRNLGIVNYFHLGKPQEGVAFFKRSLTLDPAQTDAESILALVQSGTPGRP